jgi:glycosyltransferase involved in cell wall biosynthesis
MFKSDDTPYINLQIKHSIPLTSAKRIYISTVYGIIRSILFCLGNPLIRRSAFYMSPVLPLPCDILFAVREDFQINRGGDTTQIVQTADALKALYPELRIHFVHSAQDLRQFSEPALMHVFDMRPDTLALMQAAKARRIPIVLTPIYWDFTPMYAYNGLSRKLGIHTPPQWAERHQQRLFQVYQHMQEWMGKPASYLSARYIQQRREALELADVVLPNSPEEGEIIATHFLGHSLALKHKTRVVPNAVATGYLEGAEHALAGPLPVIGHIQNYVLEVARIEPNKNQLLLVKALKDYPEIPLVFIGRLGSRQDKAYFKTLQHEAQKRGNTWIIEEMSQHMLGPFYRMAKVHVLPSFRESAGLASMEALICGTEIITAETPYCPNTYYRFSEFGYQVNPWRIKSIQQGILAAFNNAPRNTCSPEDYMQFFGYPNVAVKTLEAYEALFTNARIDTERGHFSSYEDRF